MRDRGQDKGNGERKGGVGRSRRTSGGGGRREDDDRGKDVERGKEEEERGQGAGITNERSLLFSQLFFSVP